MITTELGLKLPHNDDFYDIEDFNNNFQHIENMINALIARVNAVETALLVTGILSSNGALNFGWKPKVVIIFSTTFGTGTDVPLSIAMATSNATNTYPQRNRSSSQESLVITDIGFQTTGMTSAGAAPSASSPLRYVAFR